MKKTKRTKQVYLDNAAATPTDPVVVKAMMPFLQTQFYNPSALYQGAVNVRERVEKARKTVADILCTQPDAIVFTSGGTESVNLALLGIIKNEKLKSKNKKLHIITTATEHHAVLGAIKNLQKAGCDVTYLPVDQEGFVRSNDVKQALRPETALVSIMYANNETGSIQPIADIGREILKWRKTKSKIANLKSKINWPYFHTDACQAAGYLDLNVEKLHVDLMSLNGSKIYGPKGSGILYKRHGVELAPLMYGGGQEFGLRSGTENVHGIVGFAKALELVQNGRDKERARVEKLRDYFWKELQKRVDKVYLNGPHIVFGFGDELRLPNSLNVIFAGVDAEALIIYLDEAGIQCSSASACATDSDELSHVLLACGIPPADAKSSIRFTLGTNTTNKDINYVLKVLPHLVTQCREMNRAESKI